MLIRAEEPAHGGLLGSGYPLVCGLSSRLGRAQGDRARGFTAKDRIAFSATFSQATSSPAAIDHVDLVIVRGRVEDIVVLSTELGILSAADPDRVAVARVGASP